MDFSSAFKQILAACFVLIFLVGNLSAQPYAHNWTEITDGGDTINYTWPPPGNTYRHDQIIIKFRQGALDYGQLCYACDTIVSGALTGLAPDSLQYFPKCKETLLAQKFDTSVILDSMIKTVLAAHGVAYLKRMTAANPCADTLSLTRFGDTVPMDHYNYMVVQMGNDSSVLTTLAALYATDSSGMEFAEPNWLLVLAHSPQTPHDPWCYDPPYNLWPNYQRSLDTMDWNDMRWGIGMQTAWGYDVGSTPGYPPLIVSVIDNGIDYWRCDLGGGLGPKVLGGYDFNRNSDSTFYKGTCPFSDDHGSGASNHGTPIASIIGAYTNNFNCGGLPLAAANAMAGIAGGWQVGGGDSTNLGGGVKLLGYDVIDSTSCSPSEQDVNMQYAASAVLESSVTSIYGNYGYGASVINASWYGPPNGTYISLRTAISDAKVNGVTFVACTGNLSSSVSFWPACIEPASEMIAVGAANISTPGELPPPSMPYNVERAYYSDYNHYTDIIAPGGADSVFDARYGDVVYALQDDTLDGPTAPNSAFDAGAFVDGTSFATPQVAGVAALLRDYLSTGGYVGDPPQPYYPEDIEGILKASALDFGDSTVDPWYPNDIDPAFTSIPAYKKGYDMAVGWGLLQAGQAFKMLDPAGLGYKLVHLVAYPADESYGPWSAPQIIHIYARPNPYLTSGTYTAKVREVYATMTYSGIDTSIPVYAWGVPTGPKSGWANLTQQGGLGWSNWEDFWTEIKADTNHPSRDFGNGVVPGIRHDYSHSFVAHTYQYEVYNSKDSEIGLFPPTIQINLAVTVFGVPCGTCKIADGNPNADSETPLRVWPPVANQDITVMPGDEQLSSQFVLVDAMGRIVKDQEVLSGTGNFQLSTANLPSGLYLARLTSGNLIQQTKIVVVH